MRRATDVLSTEIGAELDGTTNPVAEPIRADTPRIRSDLLFIVVVDGVENVLFEHAIALIARRPT